ncbi:hypothetical protein N5T90_07470 [Aliarcobacter cryaerophilus]|uniref:hypothetical protein n=1 Tax=Aliarcobacter TaxID=2321111 RepID=UPI0021B19DA9|nr:MULTISPECIES: hypothetical protein [Aliarcobacter]MCT7470711.1 hypothetical protein [Aliarcobacter cryaerophilus]MCT7632069.1 hypothetical protein [Aliarcobacter butzleri]
MFTQKKKQYYSNILGFKNIIDFENFAKRYLKYLQNQTLTKNRVMAGFFILLEIQKETISKNKSLVNLENIKNQHIKKYSNTILDLRKNGMGSQSIVKFLYENHRVKVSRGTIEKFYKQNNL